MSIAYGKFDDTKEVFFVHTYLSVFAKIIAYEIITHNKYAEANYITCFLNSNFANERIKEFQNRGLFGPRDVHKSILELPFPKYDRQNELHHQLADLGNECAKKVAEIVKEEIDLEGHRLGSVRSTIRGTLNEELTRIDTLVEKISKQKR